MVLNQERELLENLQFKLEAVELVASAARHQWLERATAELQEALAAVHAVEKRRSELVSLIAASMGLSPDTTLEQLAAAADEPWSEVLRSHRSPLLELISSGEHKSMRCRQVLVERIEVTEQALVMLGQVPANEYGVDGAKGRAAAGRRRNSHLLDTAV